MKYSPEEVPEGWCEDCGQPCYGELHDDGIGPYEYWGCKGIDHRYVFLSDCCEAEILDQSPFCSECGKREIEDYGLCLECLEKEV
jgi:hypothetical protein